MFQICIYCIAINIVINYVVIVIKKYIHVSVVNFFKMLWKSCSVNKPNITNDIFLSQNRKSSL